MKIISFKTACQAFVLAITLTGISFAAQAQAQAQAQPKEQKTHACTRACKKAERKQSQLKDHVCTDACRDGKHVYAHGEKGHVCGKECHKS